VVNAAEYGFPQRRRRVFIFAEKRKNGAEAWDPTERLLSTGVLARALPVNEQAKFEGDHASIIAEYFELPTDVYEVSSTIGMERRTSPFENSGVMIDGHVWTRALTAHFTKRAETLGDVVRKTKTVDPSFIVGEDALAKWAYLKASKSEPRVDKKTGFEYRYSEGSMSFPDRLDIASRTVLTGEGGTSASRFKHIIQPAQNGSYRRLVPEELEELNGFPRGWTKTGMSDVKRAFCMGNALVVGIVALIGKEIRVEAECP
jgi:DNA (cytosine-5)-methyltransferase 1